MEGTAKVENFLGLYPENKIDVGFPVAPRSVQLQSDIRAHNKMAFEEKRAVQNNEEDNKMEVLYGTCGGVDVHKKLLVVYLRSGRKTEVKNYGTTTQE